MRFVIVTGMSGSGKLTAMKMLEDMGFFCVDNLPVPLIEKFIELANTPGSEITKVALGLDVRADQKFADAFKELERLKKNGLSYELIFMEASDKVLVKRYKETRRKHPLAGDGSIEEGIEKEREILKKVRKKADYVFDTSNLLTRVLKKELEKIFVEDAEYNSLIIRVVSFTLAQCKLLKGQSKGQLGVSILLHVVIAVLGLIYCFIYADGANIIYNVRQLLD